MNIYLVERTNGVGWDEYRAAVVYEETSTRAKLFCKNKFFDYHPIRCTLIGSSDKRKRPGVILTDMKEG